jgi:sulfur-oxidizing protein SoxY
MDTEPKAILPARRRLLRIATMLGLGFVSNAPALGVAHADGDDALAEDGDWLQRAIGMRAVPSSRIHLVMPAVFNNGYSVPMALSVDCAMTDEDYVRDLCVFAPRNPITTVVRFQFTPQAGRAEIATRIRLAQPQAVLAVATMNDGSCLLARQWVKVESNGCE